MFIHDVCKCLNGAKIPYAIVGGYAVALHGAIRGTLDIDIAIKWSLNNLKKVEAALKKLGLVSLIPITAETLFHFRDEYIEKRHLIAWNFYRPGNPLHQVDIVINFDLEGAKTLILRSSSVPIKVLSKQDLIKMKKASGRPQDLEDVKALENL